MHQDLAPAYSPKPIPVAEADARSVAGQLAESGLSMGELKRSLPMPQGHPSLTLSSSAFTLLSPTSSATSTENESGIESSLSPALIPIPSPLAGPQARSTQQCSPSIMSPPSFSSSPLTPLAIVTSSKGFLTTPPSGARSPVPCKMGAGFPNAPHLSEGKDGFSPLPRTPDNSIASASVRSPSRDLGVFARVQEQYLSAAAASPPPLTDSSLQGSAGFWTPLWSTAADGPTSPRRDRLPSRYEISPPLSPLTRGLYVSPKGLGFAKRSLGGLGEWSPYFRLQNLASLQDPHGAATRCIPSVDDEEWQIRPRALTTDSVGPESSGAYERGDAEWDQGLATSFIEEDNEEVVGWPDANTQLGCMGKAGEQAGSGDAQGEEAQDGDKKESNVERVGAEGIESPSDAY